MVYSIEEQHIPVLLSEVLKGLNPSLGKSYLDLTAGFGGHAEAILGVTRNYKDSVLIDRDEMAVEYLVRKFKRKIKIINTDFYSAVLQLIECGNTFDMILADFGVSSLQLNRENRGFAFLKAGPLDMRMDKRQELSAWTVVNKYDERKLMDILVRFGEEKVGRARYLTQEIIRNRPIKTTNELAEIIARKSKWGRIHPATRVFQAIRIEVNKELELIENTLPLIPRLLKPRGRVAMITFHSLEDRLVKRYFKQVSEKGVEAELKIWNKKPITAEKMELVINPRARSAKLRVAERS